MNKKVFFASDLHMSYNAKDVQNTINMYKSIRTQLEFLVNPNEEHMWWTTLKGEQIRIDKMTTSHLKNTIAHIKRTGRLKPPYAKKFQKVYRNMQEEYYRRLGPAGEVLFGKSKSRRTKK